MELKYPGSSIFTSNHYTNYCLLHWRVEAGNGKVRKAGLSGWFRGAWSRGGWLMPLSRAAAHLAFMGLGAGMLALCEGQ